MHLRALLLATSVLLAAPTAAAAVTINFDDVVGTEVDITTRYAALGVTLNAIANPFPLAGPFPAPLTRPPTFGGVTTWDQGFGSATSAPQVAVAAFTLETGHPGDGGILISFAFDVSFVSLVGNDLGGIGFGDDESVTLTAYDAVGNFIGQSFSTTNLPAGLFDQTPGTISFPNMRSVAFNYTDTQFGFFSIDDLTFISEQTAVPVPSTLFLFSSGLFALAGYARHGTFRNMIARAARRMRA